MKSTWSQRKSQTSAVPLAASINASTSSGARQAGSVYPVAQPRVSYSSVERPVIPDVGNHKFSNVWSNLNG